MMENNDADMYKVCAHSVLFYVLMEERRNREKKNKINGKIKTGPNESKWEQ